MSSLVCYITRFTEENFATLISVIFIFKAFENVSAIQHNCWVIFNKGFRLKFKLIHYSWSTLAINIQLNLVDRTTIHAFVTVLMDSAIWFRNMLVMMKDWIHVWPTMEHCLELAAIRQLMSRTYFIFLVFCLPLPIRFRLHWKSSRRRHSFPPKFDRLYQILLYQLQLHRWHWLTIISTSIHQNYLYRKNSSQPVPIVDGLFLCSMRRIQFGWYRLLSFRHYSQPSWSLWINRLQLSLSTERNTNLRLVFN